jgi:hypothetical protein
MTREQRDAAKQRVVALSSRLDAIQTLTENMSDKGGIAIMSIIEETKIEIMTLERTLATSLEFLFNFKGGGWNSEVAYTKEDAIEQAIFKYGHPDTHATCQVDVSTFRVSTPSDFDALMRGFY